MKVQQPDSSSQLQPAFPLCTGAGFERSHLTCVSLIVVTQPVRFSIFRSFHHSFVFPFMNRENRTGLDGPPLSLVSSSVDRLPSPGPLIPPRQRRS